MITRTALLATTLAFSALTGCTPMSKSAPTDMSASMLEPLPPAAHRAVERETAGGTLQHITNDEFMGRTVYSVDYMQGTKKGMLQVTSDGRVLSNTLENETVMYDAVPEAVKAAAASRTGGKVPTSVMHESMQGRDIYMMNLTLGGMPHTVVIDSTGALVREETGIRTTQLPPVVAAAIEQRLPQLKIKSTREVRETNDGMSDVYYVVEGKSDKKWVEASFLADGTSRSVRTK